jgi:carbonic anhydrase
MNSSLHFQRTSRLVSGAASSDAARTVRGRLSAGLPLLLLSLAAAFPAHASEPKEAVVAKAAPSDPMTHLKERLQEKLGALRAQDSANGANELKVPTRAPATAPTRAARADGDAAPRGAKAGADGHEGKEGGHWGYFGEGGPAAWAQLRPEFGLCARGNRQSPIDIRDGIAVDLEAPKFDYRPSGFSVIDNGHTVQVNVAPGNTVEVTGRRYELVQFHFHRPSEERINGRQYEMSVHLVHRDAEGRLAVVAVVLERGAAQPVVQQVWNNLPLEKNETVAAATAIDLTALLPSDMRYYTYMGSLTTPPCSEGVLWMVMQQPVPVSTAQIGIFSRLYPMNARPVQQSAGRLIKQSQ